MRLSVSRDLESKSIRGLQKFGLLLINELRSKYNVRIVSGRDQSDIHLIIISGKMKPNCKNVVRIDGVYYDLGRLKLNGPIKSTVRKADGVVFQSEWCDKFVTGMLQVSPNRSTVIHNGVNQSALSDITANKHNFDKVFVCCSSWRVNKRLKSIVQAFVEVAKEYPTTGLFIIGKPDYECSHPNVKYFGKLHGPKLWSAYKSSDYMCHICHLDACPNSVVEGLSIGLPVLCNNIGGTPEIVGESGIILPIDKPFDFRPIKNMSKVGTKSVNHDILVKGMKYMIREVKLKEPSKPKKPKKLNKPN